MSKQTIFISDLHLDASCPKIAQYFFSFLEQLDHTVDALYILGDLFNIWVGDDDLSSFHLQVQSALKEISHKLPLYFLPGNRDFLVGKQFSKRTGCTLLKDPTVIDLYGVPTILLHGDLLCSRDVKHLRFRTISQNFFMKQLFLMLPLSFRKKIAKNIRQNSRKHLLNAESALWMIDEEQVCQIMMRFGVQQMIHGHIHLQGIHSVELQNGSGKRFVLGDWDACASILTCKPDANGDGPINVFYQDK